MLVVAAVVANLFLHAFAGTFACTPHVPGVAGAPVSTWTIAAVPKSAWATVHWATRTENGTAFVGYLPPEKQWIYEDFHSDGGFGENSALPPINGVWTWTGTFTNADRTIHGASQWERAGAGFRQRYGRLLGTSFRETAHSDCRPLKR